MKNITEVKIELSDSDFIQLALIAHELDITFNELCIQILKDYISNKEKTKCTLK